MVGQRRADVTAWVSPGAGLPVPPSGNGQDQPGEHPGQSGPEKAGLEMYLVNLSVHLMGICPCCPDEVLP